MAEIEMTYDELFLDPGGKPGSFLLAAAFFFGRNVLKC